MFYAFQFQNERVKFTEKAGAFRRQDEYFKAQTNPRNNSKPNDKQLLQNSNHHPDSREKKEIQSASAVAFCMPWKFYPH